MSRRTPISGDDDRAHTPISPRLSARPPSRFTSGSPPKNNEAGRWQLSEQEMSEIESQIEGLSVGA
jgi:hypothetical protein